MKIYKVYAQCVIRPRGKAIIQITEAEARALIFEAVDDMLNMGGYFDFDYETDEEFEEAYNKLNDSAIAYFEENEFFMCGDFIITIEHDDDSFPTRAGSYGWTHDFE